MTIQELFDELRKERDWSKEVVVFTNRGFTPVIDVCPNLIDNQLLISVKEEENA